MGAAAKKLRKPSSKHSRRFFPFGRPDDPLVPRLKDKVRSLRKGLKSLAAGHQAALRAIEAEKAELERRLAVIEQRAQAANRLAADPMLQARFLEFRSHFLPKRAVGHEKIRVGRAADGGYAMLDDFDGVCTAISGGIGKEVSWDVAIADRGIDIIQVDHTVPGPPVAHPRFNFLGKRLAGEREQADDITLAELIAGCPCEGDSVLLQIDIESSEWDVFARPVPGLDRCRQIVMEFHGLDSFGDPAWRERAMHCVQQIAAGHQCIHVHGNNGGNAPMIIVGGVPFPSVWEATFVLKSRYRFVEETDSFPTSLDAPNNSKRAQHFLGRLGGGLSQA